MSKKIPAPKPTAEQMTEWTEKYRRAPKKSEIAWEMELAVGAEERRLVYLAGQAAGNARGAAIMAALPPIVYTAEQLALAGRVSDAQIAQTASFRASQAAGLYTQVETAADAYAVERASDRAHEVQ